ncbi:MAG TPA: homocysteine S-methyltransferase family protein [Alphaproteobacteria bacterium]|nr:homocysteine S-methyltransferase family protein [Alphaproteobacteria bacterium]
MTATFTLLDGGMSRELMRVGAPFRQPEWSALALMLAPETVTEAHRRFVAAGAEVITTNSYALVPFHIGEEKFRAEGRALADVAGRAARQAAATVARPVRVAGSLPPLFGSYRPDLFDEVQAPEIIRPLIEGLAPHADLWLAETQSSLAEMRFARRAVKEMLPGDTRPFWASFTLDDENEDLSRPKLRSGEYVAMAVGAALDLGIDAVLFNCSQPEIMAGALDAAQAVRLARKDGAASRALIGVYANAFVPQKDEAANEGLSDIRPDLTPEAYAHFALAWRKLGADIIGGCCGIGSEHIAALRALQG